MKICDNNLLNQISGGRGDHDHGRSSASGHEGHSHGGDHSHGGGHDHSGHDHGGSSSGNHSVSVNTGYSERSGAYFGAEATISW